MKLEKTSYRSLAIASFKHVTGASARHSLLAVGGDWLIIAGSVYLATRFPGSTIVSLAAIFLIASRQHALLVLMHEGAHGHLLRYGKANDLASNVFTAWPFGMSTERYRTHHWKHHQFTNTVDDPDWGRKVEHPHWQFPKSRVGFWKDFLPYLMGLGLRELWFARKVIGVKFSSSPGAVLYYAAAFGAIAYLHGWMVFAEFWLLPMLTILPVLMKVRSIVEHLGLPHNSELTNSRNIIGSPLEAFFFGPHSNALHLIHHMYPQVPWHKVKALREILRKDDHFRNHAHENRGYFLPNARSAFRELTRAKKEKHLKIAS